MLDDSALVAALEEDDRVATQLLGVMLALEVTLTMLAAPGGRIQRRS